MRTKHYILATLLAAVFTFGILGCEVGINPLIFDGAVLQASFRADDQTLAPDSIVVDLNDVVEAIKEVIDSIDVINITILIDSTNGNAATTVSGTVTINGDTLMVLRNVPLSAFTTERSIFQLPPPTGFSFDWVGVNELRRALRNRESSPTATFVISGSTNNATTHFTVHFKVYTQVITTP